MTDEAAESEITQKVSSVLEQIRPMIQADGGDIELVGIDEASGTVSIRFQGACRGCVREKVPEIKEVVAVD